MSAPLWNPNILCDGLTAGDRADYFQQHEGLTAEAAREKVAISCFACWIEVQGANSSVAALLIFNILKRCKEKIDGEHMHVQDEERERERRKE